MSDLISRDNCIKAFEEEKQKAKDIRDDFAKFPDSVFEQSIYNEAVKAWRTAIDIVKKLPTVDAVEVVRCRDCVHQQKVFHEDKRIKEGGYYICGCELADGYSVVCLDGDFCSRGERRTDE